MNSTHETLLKLMSHLQLNGFLRVSGNAPALLFEYGPSGQLLLENIRNEWKHSVTTFREFNVFPFYSGPTWSSLKDISFAYDFCRKKWSSELPFGLSTELTLTEYHPFFSSTTPLLKNWTFHNPNDSQQFFYRWQQHRKRWWRKFSTNPGNFSFGEVTKKEGTTAEEAKILVNFPWGQYPVETIKYIGPEDFDVPLREQNIFSAYSGRKRCIPHIIESDCRLDVALFTFLSDAFAVNKTGKPVLRFHRKLSPYKFGFAAFVEEPEKAEELHQFAQMLSLDLRSEGLPTLLPPASTFTQIRLDTQIQMYNDVGTPFVVVLNPDTLHSGIFGLHNRDTTLEEQVHAGKFETYGPLLMKNY